MSSKLSTTSNTDHELFKKRLVGQVFLEHVDVLEDSLDDGVHVPLPVVRQLHRHQHQAEPGHDLELFLEKFWWRRDPGHEKENSSFGGDETWA